MSEGGLQQSLIFDSGKAPVGHLPHMTPVNLLACERRQESYLRKLDTLGRFGARWLFQYFPVTCLLSGHNDNVEVTSCARWLVHQSACQALRAKHCAF